MDEESVNESIWEEQNAYQQLIGSLGKKTSQQLHASTLMEDKEEVDDSDDSMGSSDDDDDGDQHDIDTVVDDKITKVIFKVSY